MARELKPRSLAMGVARCRPLPRALQAMSRNQHDVRLWIFVRRLQKRTHRRRSSIEKLIPNQSILALTARACALQHYMSFIPKMKEVPESGFRF